MSEIDNINQKLSGHICSTCGGPAPEWKCPSCGFSSPTFDPSHFQKCDGAKMMQAQCEKCDEAESNCTCDPVV